MAVAEGYGQSSTAILPGLSCAEPGYQCRRPLENIGRVATSGVGVFHPWPVCVMGPVVFVAVIVFDAEPLVFGASPAPNACRLVPEGRRSHVADGRE